MVLFVTGVLAFGLLDGFTAVLMMGKYGIGVEGNPLLRQIRYMYGPIGFIMFKVLAAALILSLPLIYYKEEDLGWTSAGFLSVFTTGGIVAAIDNYFFLMSGHVWIESQIVIGSVLLMVLVVLHAGDILDSKKRSQREIRFRIPDDRWDAMKQEMGYPGEA
ncbi:MAG: DUF5658 family protein [Halobacteriota archaeon]